MFTSIVRFQSSILRRSSGEWGISPELLSMTSIRPYVSTAVSTSFVTEVGDIRADRECFAALTGKLIGYGRDANDTPRTQDDRRALL